MSRIIVAAVFTVALVGTGLAFADSGQSPTAPDPKVGTRVTITGCLHKGASSGSFVLLGVTERPAGSAASGQLVPFAIYWLDSNDGLKGLVGEMVDITGKVKERRPHQGTITTSFDPEQAASTDVRVASQSKTLDVTSKKFDGGPQGASGAAIVVQVKRPVYKLDVETVRAVAPPVDGPACR
jgi:hypothetical protein